MHMADALISPTVGAAMYAASAATTGISIYRLRSEDRLRPELTSKRLPTMAVMSSLVFAGQMVNYTIPGTGSSGHLCGGLLLTALLGPWAGFLSMAAVLIIQCLFFADGGLLALGANLWNMAFYGCFAGYYLIYRPILGAKRLKAPVKLTLASVLGCVLSLQLGALSVVIETSLSGVTELPFGAFLALMQPIHLAIGAVEGLITAAVLVFVYNARPELPDGLEWSLFGNSEAGYSENMGLDEDAYGIDSPASRTAGGIQEKTAFLPDYGFAGGSGEPLGTSVSGIAGAAMVAVLAGLVCLCGSLLRRRGAGKK